MSARFVAIALRPMSRALNERLIAFLTQNGVSVGNVARLEGPCPELPCAPEEILELIRAGAPLPIVCVPTTTPPQCLDMGGVLGMESQSVSVFPELDGLLDSLNSLNSLGLDDSTTDTIEAINSFDFDFFT